MPQNDRHKEREIPIEFDFYNTLESLPVDNRLHYHYDFLWKHNCQNQ